MFTVICGVDIAEGRVLFLHDRGCKDVQGHRCLHRQEDSSLEKGLHGPSGSEGRCLSASLVYNSKLGRQSVVWKPLPCISQGKFYTITLPSPRRFFTAMT